MKRVLLGKATIRRACYLFKYLVGLNSAITSLLSNIAFIPTTIGVFRIKKGTIYQYVVCVKVKEGTIFQRTPRYWCSKILLCICIWNSSTCSVLESLFCFLTTFITSAYLITKVFWPVGSTVLTSTQKYEKAQVFC